MIRSTKKKRFEYNNIIKKKIKKQLKLKYQNQ
jgi:hypothetical protein